MNRHFPYGFQIIANMPYLLSHWKELPTEAVCEFNLDDLQLLGSLPVAVAIFCCCSTQFIVVPFGSIFSTTSQFQDTRTLLHFGALR